MEYIKKTERISDDVYTETYTKRKRQCDICSSLKESQDITIVKYPVIDKYLGRVIMTKKVCMDCHSDVMEVLNNLKYN